MTNRLTVSKNKTIHKSDPKPKGLWFCCGGENGFCGKPNNIGNSLCICKIERFSCGPKCFERIMKNPEWHGIIGKFSDYKKKDFGKYYMSQNKYSIGMQAILNDPNFIDANTDSKAITHGRCTKCWASWRNRETPSVWYINIEK